MAYIKVDIATIKQCIGDKQNLEALAIAAFFKARYTNSMIYSHTIREYKRIACMGSERLRRALDRARTLGLVRGKGNSLIVGNLHTGRRRTIRIERTMSFKDIIRSFREAVLKDAIGAVNFIENIAKKAVGRKACKNRVASCRRLRKYNVDLNDIDRIGTISRKVLARKIGMSKSYVSSMVRTMEKERKMKVEYRFEFLCTITGKVSLAVLNKYNDAGFVVRQSDRLLRQLPSHYEYA